MIFDDLTNVYEAMIDWPKRLANEEPFYRRLIERTGAKVSSTWPAAPAGTPPCCTGCNCGWKGPTSVRE